MKLTRTQHAVLSSALQRDDGTLDLPSKRKRAAANNLAAKLVAEGLADEIAASGSMPIWREDEQEQPIALRITDFGVSAIKGSQSVGRRKAGAGKKGPTRAKAVSRKRRAKPRPKTAEAGGTPARSAGASKQDRVLALLRRQEGATIERIMKATDWQQHSVRGFLAAVVRKKLRLKLTSEMVRGVRTYRIAASRAGKAG